MLARRNRLAAPGLWLAALLLAVLVAGATERGVAEAPTRRAAQWVPGQLIVRFIPSRGFPVLPQRIGGEAAQSTVVEVRRAARAEMDQVASRIGFRVLDEAVFTPGVAMPQGLFLYKVQVSEDVSLDEAARLLERQPGVLYASRNYIRQTREAGPGRPPDDPGFPEQWGLHNTAQTFEGTDGPVAGTPDADVDALEAWNVQIGDGSSPVVVAVLDSGLQPDHPDLAANMWRNPRETPDNGIDDDENGLVDDVYGWDFFHDDASVYDPVDREMHGTHVAGIIGAVADNGVGIAGVAWNVRIMALKFIGPEGGQDFDAIRALAYARSIGDRDGLRMLTNNSWGGPGASQATKDAIEASDMLFVAAAGNDAKDNDVEPDYPASYDSPNIISVAATDWNDRLAEFSHWGATSVDLAAPGHRTLSLYPTDNPDRHAQCEPPATCLVIYESGTSMAAPHVAGVAALVMSQLPAATWAEVKQRILDSVDPLPALEGKMVTGGRLNARKALGSTPPPGEPAPASYRVVPNPAFEQARFLYDPSSVAGGTVRIFDVAGRPVARLPLSETGESAWDLTDSSGRPVSSGLYLWLLFDKDSRPVFTRPQRLVVQR